MFDIKCVDCKFFNPYDLSCAKGEKEENCKIYQPIMTNKELFNTCTDCAFYSNGFCDYDLSDPKTCRRFKDKKED